VAGGVVYGPDRRFGCYNAVCGGINSDISVELFAAVGFYTDFDAVGGTSFANVQEAQIPGDLLNFSTSQVFSREPGEIIPSSPALIGIEDAFSVGVGAGVIPFSAASLLCDTVLDTVITSTLPFAPPPLAVAPSVLGNPGFALDLGGWSCIGEGTCARADDDAAGKEGAGSGEVTSPPPGIDPGIAYLASSCASVMPGQPYQIEASVKTLGARPGTLTASWNTGLDCDGGLARSDVLGMSPPDDTWRRLRNRLDAPDGAQSVRLLVSAERDANSATASTSRIDAVLIPEPGAASALLVALCVLGSLAARRYAAPLRTSAHAQSSHGSSASRSARSIVAPPQMRRPGGASR
jgi:hypothetical protein